MLLTDKGRNTLDAYALAQEINNQDIALHESQLSAGAKAVDFVANKGAALAATIYGGVKGVQGQKTKIPTPKAKEPINSQTTQSAQKGMSVVDGEMAGGNKLPKLISSEGIANAAAGTGLKLDLKTTQAANSVVDSLRQTGKLPSNYITKETAIKHGWQPGKALDSTNKGAQIGGDVFSNNPPILPSSSKRVWYEADIGLNNKMSRSNPSQPGSRLLYSNDGLLYITTDHYKSVHKIGSWK